MFFKRIESNNFKDAQVKAEHNFTVNKKNLFFNTNLNEFSNYETKLVPDKQVVLKNENNKYLGTVGIKWEPIQPEELYEIANILFNSCDDAHKKIVGGFSLYNDAVIGISLRLKIKSWIQSYYDPFDLNFLLMTSFNGMYGISGHAYIERQKTLSQARMSNKVFNLKHTKFVQNRLDSVKNMLRFYQKEIDIFDKKMQQLLDTSMSLDLAGEFFKSIHNKAKSNRAKKMLETQWEKFLSLYVNIPSAYKNTAFGVWLSLTEYINKEKLTKIHKNKNEEEIRFESIHMGNSNKLMQKGTDKLINFELTEDDFLL